MKIFIQNDSSNWLCATATPPLFGGQSPVDFGARKCEREGL